MSLSTDAFVTDFADQAVVLPVIVCVAVALWSTGWWRGTLMWSLGTSATLATMAVLKFAFRACGPNWLGAGVESPSGHTAAAGAVYGSILAFIVARLGARMVSQSLVVFLVVLLFGTTRVLLGAHTIEEVDLGGGIGFAAAHVIVRGAGKPVGDTSGLLWCLPLLAVPVLLHGFHLQAEQQIDLLALSLWPFSACR